MAKAVKSVPRRPRASKIKEEPKAEAAIVEKVPEEIGPLPSPEELLDEALNKVRRVILTQDAPSKDAVANFIQLLKMRKEMGGSENSPREVKVIWQDPWDEESDS